MMTERQVAKMLLEGPMLPLSVGGNNHFCYTSLPKFDVFDVEFASVPAKWMHHSQLFDSRSHFFWGGVGW